MLVQRVCMLANGKDMTEKINDAEDALIRMTRGNEPYTPSPLPHTRKSLKKRP